MSPKNHKNKLRKAPLYVMLLSLAIWMLGVASGEPAMVLKQAVQICFSCIGIG